MTASPTADPDTMPLPVRMALRYRRRLRAANKHLSQRAEGNEA
jgi:hypothetical protein